jgi:N-glycosylase/DNA lyase
MRYDGSQLEAAVRSICPDIQQRVDGAARPRDERALWWELSSCVLSSQVPYVLATAAADAVDQTGALPDGSSLHDLGMVLHEALRRPLTISGRERHYRFPAVRATQLARIHEHVHADANTLGELLAGFDTADDARRWFVERAPGLGPKQASMFLRNVGVSYDLAVIDRHVLDYMSLTGLRQLRDGALNSLARYCTAEAILRAHADAVTCSVGIMDWAIWIVMRVAKRERILES